MTTLQRLVGHTHSAVFDKAPQTELAFRLRHPDRARWSIAERSMTAYAGAAEHTYDLAALTVQQLMDQLSAAGFQVLPSSPHLARLSAIVLVEGDGDEYISNGDQVHGFTSLLWVLMSGYAGEVAAAQYQLGQALRQMQIPQAQGEWLDLWGMLYAQQRLPGETEEHFADRIPQEAFRIRCNARAIELAIRDATGFDVRIEEPWMNIFRLDHSLLSGPDKFYDGETVGYHLIKPTAKTQIDWPAVKAVIDRNRAAGVILLGPEIIYRSHVLADIDGTIHFGGVLLAGGLTRYEDKALLDYMRIEDVSVPNHPAIRKREVKHTSGSQVDGHVWEEVIWPDQPWNTDYYVFSKHTSDFRVHYIALTYSSVRWSDLAGKTWSDLDGTAWSGLSTVIHSGHTSSS